MEHPNHSPAVLRTQRTLPFAPDAIYAAFADPRQLAIWWGPQGFSNTFDIFDFTTGGHWKFVMHGPDGTHYPNECVFQELEPGRRVVIAHTSAPHFTLTVRLQALADGTVLQWEQAFDDPRVAQAVRHIAEPGNEQNLDRLHQHLHQHLRAGQV